MGEAPWYSGREHTQQMRMGNRGGEQERKTRTGGCNERAAFGHECSHRSTRSMHMGNSWHTWIHGKLMQMTSTHKYLVIHKPNLVKTDTWILKDPQL